ncbi:hypothetical protein [Granulicella sp. dw_53]|uniref:hypothetical protein n=1 Tax=Granulicella sp. dw_53 TaxID=2719792 RepID=UPI001BD40DB0|nr:hypothetical protein [Granulicella sp. dw_53]
MYPASEQERQLVRNELAELLKTVHFTNSKRYPALLLYVVEKTLEGRSEDLKERILGIEVFQREANYDTNSDTIVRVTAGEVRKRLAAIYHESGFEHAIQITLPAGSYVPEFFQTTSPDMSIPTPKTELAVIGFNNSPSRPEDSNPAPLPISFWKTWSKTAIGATLVLLAVTCPALLLHLRTATSRSSVDRFWQPLSITPSPTIICPGAVAFSSNGFNGIVKAEKKDEYPYTSITTAGAIATLADLFAKHDIEAIVQPTTTITLTDMTKHPTVLIGAYDNEWTLRLLNDLRFRFAPNPARQIYDETNPSTIWVRPTGVPFKDRDDYAVVARFHDRLTDNLVVVIAGVGKNGTEAAIKFVTTPRYLDLLNRQSKDWASKNIEIVLKTKVVDSKTGAPSIEAAYIW